MTSSRRAFTYVPQVLGGQPWPTLSSKSETSPTLRRVTSRTNGASGLPVRGCRDRATPPRCFSCSTVSPHAGHVACTQSDAAAVSREVGGEGMCGIVGIIKLNARETVDEARLKRMRDVLRHRGPDGEGLWIGGPVGLGMRRLAIVDVLGGRQPMANEDETIWIVYNGEIYNHAALRPGLEARGHRYRTRSDTETILHLYEEEQERCVERLRGMFAFALWDRTRKRLLLARDRLGIKPLYYAVTPRELLFASEIKAILAAESIRPALNETILPEFLATRFVAGEETFFRGVRKLLPGRTLTWSVNDGFHTRRYWRLTVREDNSGGGLEARAR